MGTGGQGDAWRVGGEGLGVGVCGVGAKNLFVAEWKENLQPGICGNLIVGSGARNINKRLGLR